MNAKPTYFRALFVAAFLVANTLWMLGCSAGVSQEDTAASDTSPSQAEVEASDEHEHEGEAAAEMLLLPELSAIDLNGEPLSVVATTSIIGDVVAQVGGEAITLTTLIGPGQDPHSFVPSARDLTAAAEAHVIFLNGWDLEEGLAHDLEEIVTEVPIVPISANIAPLAFGEEEHDHADEAEEHEGEEEADDHDHADEAEEHEDEEEADDHDHADEAEEHEGEEGAHEHEHAGADPHVWFSLHNVEQWVMNVEQVLSALDPDNATTYAGNAAAYLVDLDKLANDADALLAQIPSDQRILVTNHDSFRYFAEEYGFEVLGTIIPSQSTLAEPSARELAGLITEMQAHGVCTIFSETTVSASLAETVAGELDGCELVQVLPLYTGALGPSGSGADSYIGMFRANVETIVAGLSQ